MLLLRNAIAGAFLLAGCGSAKPPRMESVAVGQFESPSAAPSNSWWVGTPDGGVVLFDAQRTISDARALIAKLQVTGKPLRAIILTHPHPDHITGVGVVKAAFPNAPIYSTAGAEDYLAGKGRELLGLNVAMFGANAVAAVPKADRLMGNGQQIVIGGLTIDVRLLGTGESPAAAVFLIPSIRTLVVGDVLTPRRVPFLAGAETAAWLRQIAVLRRRYDPTTRVLPGHGPQAALADAATWQAGYLGAFRTLITRASALDSPDGACVNKQEAATMLSEMRRRFPTTDGVARMPPEALDALNVEGVSHELTRKRCPGVANPVR